MAIQIEFLAKIVDFLRGTDDVGDALADVEDNLGDVGDTGEDAGSTVADGLEDASDAADDTTGKLGEVSGALGDVGNVAKDALEGDLAGAATSAIEAISGIASAIPGVGGLVATGVGEIASGIVGLFEEAAKRSEDRVSAMYNDMAESGSNYLSETFLLKEAQEQIETNYDRIAEVAQLTGLTEAEVVRAMVTAGEERNAVLEIANQKWQENSTILTNLDGSYAGVSEKVSGLNDQYTMIVSEFGRYNDEQSDAITKSDLFRQATSTALSEAKVGVEDLKSATESFAPIAIGVDLSRAQADLDAFLNRGHKLIVRAETVVY